MPEQSFNGQWMKEETLKEIKFKDHEGIVFSMRNETIRDLHTLLNKDLY
jgi:hypothetical protein